MNLAMDPRLLAPVPQVRQQSFDGSQNNTITNNNDFANTDFTLSGQVRFDTFDQNNETIWSQQDGTGTGRSWLYVDSSTQKWITSIGGSASAFDSTIAPALANAWHVFVLSYDHAANVLSLTVDGVLETKNSIVAENANGDFVVGAAKNANPVTSLNGTLRDLRFNNSEYYNGLALLV